MEKSSRMQFSAKDEETKERETFVVGVLAWATLCEEEGREREGVRPRPKG